MVKMAHFFDRSNMSSLENLAAANSLRWGGYPSRLGASATLGSIKREISGVSTYTQNDLTPSDSAPKGSIFIFSRGTITPRISFDQTTFDINFFWIDMQKKLSCNVLNRLK
jgi:hypothetical protein